ncbi:helix-turn-helix transcriptional regulator [Tenacibaculum sp. IB213877]|uniref:helix-turn-helix domain-containing protein n=1 Tax=Tenacibaculum sp. IB213877 TaxID=3097351 RepID=UPI002A5AA653|nr:helix-turn-helix transcriptional regulator [Tenacibaculum sp. IB213877]MDY0780139.1 helix-turn-helix transcriptional regulator [Tenacibaculum sp. IB213877]
MKNIQQFKYIHQYHELAGLPKPEHPLVSLIDYSQVNYQLQENSEFSWVQDYFSIALKKNIHIKLRYGQQEYDFDEGLMSFFSPGQVMNMQMNKQSNPKPSGWILMIHPDFLWNTNLAKNIKKYPFFGYAVNEALFLSEKEELMIATIMQNIQKEYHTNIDKFSQNIIISQIEVLLNYADRFYERQFITRKITNHQILEDLENILSEYFNNDQLIEKGLPTVQFVADNLHVSPNYLSSLLKVLTGQSTQQHIHEKLIEKAKEKLSTTQLSVSEIAYELGFEHSQSFSRLFKTKTQLSPLEFRNRFN